LSLPTCPTDQGFAQIALSVEPSALPYYGIGRIYGNEDRQIMSEAVDVVPYKMDAAGMTLAHRPRLYWCDWELPEMEGVHIHRCPQAQFGDFHVVQLEAELNAADFLELGGLCKMSSSSCPLSLRHGLHRSRGGSPRG
jgi:DNA-binding NarL/FixJ family response regulator